LRNSGWRDMRVFLDTNFLINLIVETEFSEIAKKLLERIVDLDLVTSVNVIEETIYVLRRILRRDNKYLIGLIKTVVDGLELEIIDCISVDVFFDVLSNYDLLPNDALIAATCKHHGIKKIATFDEDFKRVDFLEVIHI